MLFNKDWDKPKKTTPQKTKADPFRLDTLLQWLEMQPADAYYLYGSAQLCVLSQYFKAHGYKKVHMGTEQFTSEEMLGFAVWLPPDFDEIARGGDGLDFRRHTFGKALQRAKAFAA